MRTSQLVEITVPVYASRRDDLSAELVRMPARSVGVVREVVLASGTPFFVLAFQTRRGRLFARVAPWLVEALEDA